MIRLRNTATLLAAITLSSCATQPMTLTLKHPPVQPLRSTDAFISDRLPTQAEAQAYTLLEGKYFGSSGASGSLAAGLLFGPLGVAANVAYINSENTRRTTPLKVVADLNLAKLLSEQVAALPAGPRGERTSYELIPAANFYFKSDTSYWLTCVLTADLPQPGQASWRARYAVATEGSFDSSSSSDTQRAADAVAPCLRDAYQLFVDHVSGSVGTFEPRTISTKRIDGQGTVDEVWNVAIGSLPGRIIANDVSGLVQFRKSELVSVR